MTTTISAKDSLQGLSIAIISDVHVHDVYADLGELNALFPVPPKKGRHATIHRMERQLSISRLENESVFAFLAALDDVVDRGIRYVILPGDFTSEGTMMNIRAVRKILEEYTSIHGLRFFLACGNHDPRYPYRRDGGFTNLLGQEGKQQPVMSRRGMYEAKDNGALPTAIHEDLSYGGYYEILSAFGEYGFKPLSTDHYWETPFSDYRKKDYSFDKALEWAPIGRRQFYIHPGPTPVADTSYLVEPIEGLWLLSIDANVYIPTGETTPWDDNPDFRQSGGAGYNEVLRHKAFLTDWMESVVKRAREKGNVLISFSHYPMLEYCEGATPEIRQLLDRPHLITVPDEEVSRVLANTGIGLHFGGHVHTNGTATRNTPEGHFLVDIQVPSTAGYPPEYKILTIRGNNQFEIDTVAVNKVDRLSEFFDLYREEHDQLRASEAPHIWDKGILESQNYREFTQWHLHELVFRYRHFPQRWPDDLAELLRMISGQDVLVFSQLEANFLSGVLTKISSHSLSKFRESKEWEVAEQKASLLVAEIGLHLDDFKNWNGKGLVFDFYRLYTGRELAFEDIGEEQIIQYRLLHQEFSKIATSALPARSTEAQLVQLLGIVNTMLDAKPSRHFLIDLNKGIIEGL